ncbi:hypothetical protein ACIBG8_29340 [Nonomuraea sp. NPDC050556]
MHLQHADLAWYVGSKAHMLKDPLTVATAVATLIVVDAMSSPGTPG